MVDTRDLAQQFSALHASGKTLVLPTVWDTWSAEVAATAGFEGLTVGSHPVADATGSADGENMDFDEYLGVVKRIVDAVDIPVSADVESGYSLEPHVLIQKLLEVGAVGANIEDVVHSEGKRIRDRAEHAEYIAAARQAADEAGVEFVINGRTDAVKLGTNVFADPLAEAAERLRMMEKAGAKAVYPVGLQNADQVKLLVNSVNIPVNVTVHPRDGHGAGHLQELIDLGVRRATFGPLWQKWLTEVSAQRLSEWLR